MQGTGTKTRTVHELISQPPLGTLRKPYVMFLRSGAHFSDIQKRVIYVMVALPDSANIAIVTKSTKPV